MRRVPETSGSPVTVAAVPVGDTVPVDDDANTDELDGLPPWTPPADLPAFAGFGPYSDIASPTLSIENPGGIHIGAFVRIGALVVIEALVPERGVTVLIEDGAYIGTSRASPRSAQPTPSCAPTSLTSRWWRATRPRSSDATTATPGSG